MYSEFLKPVLDFCCSIIILILLSPIFIAITLLLFFANNGKPFFVQKRPGLYGDIFNIIKFKTMNDKKDEFGNLLPDYKRFTKIGTFIRKTSLDEIPQLINVLKGDMSIIGPRPLLPEYLPMYNEQQKKRHNIKPGITGWAQVNGRNALSWDEKFRYDLEYVNNASAKLDFIILLKTAQKIIDRKGVNADSLITMEAFKGNIL